MKKILLLISFVIISFSTAFAAADPNPYAYNLRKISYDDNSKTLVIGYSLNAPADSIFVYAEDAGGRKYQLCHIGARGAGDHTESLQLLYADDVDILPRNEQLTWGVAAKGKKYNTHQTCDRKIASHTPFSISIDRNPNSDYFGRIITTQANNNYSVGLYAYDAGFRGGYYCLDPDPDDVYLGNNQNWYANTFLTPYRVRIIQDGSGRVLVSSAAVGQPVYLWALQNPNDLNDWTPLIYSHTMKEYAPVGLNNPTDDSMGNIDFDLKIDGDKLDILLFGSSLTGTTIELVLTESDKSLHSGIYSCNLSDLQGGNYRALTEDDRKGGNPHPLVTNSNYCSLASAQTAYDKYGGVWFCGYHLTAVGFHEYPSLYHLINGNAALAQSYSDDDYLRRKNVGSAAICYNKTFDRFAISQGNLTNEARIYNVSQAEGAHPVLSNGSSVDMTSNATNPKLIADMCWDYADNLYLCVRNRDADLQGVWVVAAALNGDTTSTPAPINKGNEFTMTCRDVQHRVTATSSISMSCKIQNADGTDFVDGLYDECSKITLKAVPSAGYKFLGWKKDGNLVSTDLTYSFYVTQETNIMAMFEYAVYNVEWYGLFQSREDITDYHEGANAEMDKTKNTRLWRLFQVEYNAKEDDRADKGKLGADYNVMGFVQYDQTLDFMTNETYPFNWLAKYFMHVVGESTVAKFKNNSKYNIWGYHIYAFINRTSSVLNGEGNSAYIPNTLPKDFSKFPAAGNPDRWRKFWLKEECGLDTLLSYDKDLPKTWNQRTPPTGSITVSGQGELKPSKWYKWNNQAANPNKLLAWYYDDKNNPTWPANPTIVRNAYKDGALFATWVDKSISEDEDKQQKNSDVIYLLNHHNGTHNIEVDRTLQANMYNTFCLPFGVNAKSQLPSELQDATFVKFDGVENLYETSGDEVAVLNFSEVTFSGADTLEAGKPYLVLPKTDISTSKVYTNIKTDYKNGDKNNPTVVERAKTVTQETANGGHVSFCGTINSVSIPEQTVILVADSRLAKTTEAGNMLGLRGYFIVDDPYIQTLADDGRLYLSMKKPVTTSVPVAPEAEQQRKPEVKKIMRNGQIYIIRDGITYTITGARVR